MKYRAITIAREFGSGGAEIAQAVATALGWRLLDRAMLQEIAVRAGVPEDAAVAVDEHLDPWLYRIMRPVLGKGADGVSAVMPVDIFDAEAAAGLADAVIEEAYREGNCVIVGRGAQCVLHARPDVLHVFIYASRANRVRRVEARTPHGIDVRALIEKTNQQRLDYVRRYFGVNRLNPHLYDLMINSHGEPETAAALVLTAVRGARPVAA